MNIDKIRSAFIRMNKFGDCESLEEKKKGLN